MYYIKPNSYESYLRKPTNSQVQKHNTWHLRIATVCHRGSERRRKAKKLFSCPSIFVHASSSLSSPQQEEEEDGDGGIKTASHQFLLAKSALPKHFPGGCDIHPSRPGSHLFRVLSCVDLRDQFHFQEEKHSPEEGRGETMGPRLPRLPEKH